MRTATAPAAGTVSVPSQANRSTTTDPYPADPRPAINSQFGKARDVAVARGGGSEPLILLDLDIDESPLPWQVDALCAQTEPEAFFPEKGGSTREAKRVCGRCDVRGDCLSYALEHDERFGIWGGLSERERRRLKKRHI